MQDIKSTGRETNDLASIIYGKMKINTRITKINGFICLYIKLYASTPSGKDIRLVGCDLFLTNRC